MVAMVKFISKDKVHQIVWRYFVISLSIGIIVILTHICSFYFNIISVFNSPVFLHLGTVSIVVSATLLFFAKKRLPLKKIDLKMFFYNFIKSQWPIVISFTIILVLVGYILIDLSVENGDIAQEIMKNIGLALIASAITSLTLNLIISWIFTLETKDTIDELKNTISIYKGSQKIGLKNLYADRQEAMIRITEILRTFQVEKYEEETDHKETDQKEIDLKKSKNNPIYFIGFSLRDFFQAAQQPRYINADETIVAAIKVLLIRALNNGWKKDPLIRVLIANPLSQQGVFRMVREEIAQIDDAYDTIISENIRKTSNICTRSSLSNDVCKTLKELDEIKASVFCEYKGEPSIKEKDKIDDNYVPIEIRAYNTSPSCFLVLIPGKSLFVEQYHYGTPRDRVSGGQAPVLEFGSESPLYYQMEAHAEFVWEFSVHNDKNKLNEWFSEDDNDRIGKIWESIISSIQNDLR